MDDFHPDFLQVPYEVLQKVSPHAAFVYAVVYWFHHLKDGRCTASNQRIADVLPHDTTAHSVQNALTELEQAGFIQRLYKDEAKKHRTQIIPLVRYARVSPTDDTVSPTDDSWYHPQVTRAIKERKNSNIAPSTSLKGAPTDSHSPRALNTPLYTYSNLDDDGNEIPPAKQRKPRETWAAERAVFQTFADTCHKAFGQRPEPPQIWQLQRIRTVLSGGEFDAKRLANVFDEWINYNDRTKDEDKLQIHKALSAAYLNEFKMKYPKP